MAAQTPRSGAAPVIGLGRPDIAGVGFYDSRGVAWRGGGGNFWVPERRSARSVPAAMKVDLKLISAALGAVLEQYQVGPHGAVPLRVLAGYWEGIRLRSGDLASGIEELYRQGQIGLESRQDGLWVRRHGHAAQQTPYGRLSAAVNGLVTGLALEQVQRRQTDAYFGQDRRRRADSRQA